MNRKIIQIRRLNARYHAERGFALLEILIAFVILALGLGAISTGIAIAMRSDSRSLTSRIAFLLAQSRLEAIGISEVLVPGRREGRTANHYKWQETVAVAHIGTEPPAPQGIKPGQTAPDAGIAPFWVEIAVQAPDGSVARLSALKLGLEKKQ